MGFVPNSRGNKAAANLRPKSILAYYHMILSLRRLPVGGNQRRSVGAALRRRRLGESQPAPLGDAPTPLAPFLPAVASGGGGSSSGSGRCLKRTTRKRPRAGRMEAPPPSGGHACSPATRTPAGFESRGNRRVAQPGLSIRVAVPAPARRHSVRTAVVAGGGALLEGGFRFPFQPLPSRHRRLHPAGPYDREPGQPVRLLQNQPGRLGLALVDTKGKPVSQQRLPNATLRSAEALPHATLRSAEALPHAVLPKQGTLAGLGAGG